MKAYFRPMLQPYTQCAKCDGRGVVYATRSVSVVDGRKVCGIERRACDCENGLIPVRKEGVAQG